MPEVGHPPILVLRTLQYRVASVVGLPPGETCEDFRSMLARAIDRYEKVEERKWSTSDEFDAPSLVLNAEIRAPNSVFGELLKWIPRGNQILIGTSHEENRLRLLSMDPPDDYHEFVRGALFFYAYGNGVVLMTTNTFGEGEAARYFTWLLRSTNVLAEGARIEFGDDVSQPIEAYLSELTGAKTLKLTVDAGDALSASRPSLSPDRATVRDRLGGILRELLEEVTPSVDPSSALGDQALSLSLEISLPPRSRTDSGVLNAISQVATSMNGTSWDLRLRNGVSISQHGARLRAPKRILHRYRYPDYTSTEESMKEFVADLIRGRMIRPPTT